ncbi:MAG: 50S ribosomal protein L24 [Proteobacteria bacterium]|nr:50S ribosomal protein L24 [Pseudomonadota bacterium]
MGHKWRIKKGDEVIVLSGRDKGAKGKVLVVVRKTERVLVQGVNMVKRHTRPSSAGPGGIIEKEAPIHVSNVAHIDPKSSRPTRVGYRTLGDGRKVRFAKRSGEIIDA